MLNRFLTSFLLLLFAGLSASAQTTEISGKVTDAKTGESIAYVNIRLTGTLRSTYSEPDGTFRIKTIEKIDSIKFSYLGYKTRTFAIKRGTSVELDVVMGNDEMQLKEVTIKAGRNKKRVIDTTANYVYYQVLKHKEFNRPENIDNYTYNSYDKLSAGVINPKKFFLNFFLFKPFKFLFNNVDTTEEGTKNIPGYIQETYSNVAFRKSPRKLSKTVVAENVSGIENTSVLNLFTYQFQEVNPYENLFVLFSKSFMSPFAPGAVGTYLYYLTDTAILEGRISYKLYFVARTKEDVALKGFAWIDSATWAIKHINFRPNEKANVNFVNDYYVSQTYLRVNEKYWILEKEQLQAIGSILKGKNRMGVLIKKSHECRDILTDVKVPDSLFKADYTIVLPGARKRGEAFMDSLRFEPLRPTEKMVYYNSDTITKVKAYKLYFWFGNLFTSGYMKTGPVEFGRINKVISKNNVEGWRVRMGFVTNKQFSKVIRLSGYGAYGIKDKDWKYEIEARVLLPSKNDKWSLLGVYYRYDLQVLGQENILLTFDNIFTLIGGKVFTKIMKIRDLNIYHEREWVRGYSQMIGLSMKTYYQVPGAFEFSRLNAEGFRVNVPKFNITELSLDNRYVRKETFFATPFYRFFIANKYPAFLFRYDLGMLDIEKEFSVYHRFNFTIKQRLSSVLGMTSYQLKSGIIVGKVPYVLGFVTYGNFGYILDRLNYNLLKEFEFVTDKYLSFWLEHHFEGLIFNKIPGFNKLRLREVVSFKMLWGGLNTANANLFTLPADVSVPSKIPYMEAGFGIENILEVIRVDFVWRLTYRDKPGVQTWGIKIGLNPRF